MIAASVAFVASPRGISFLATFARSRISASNGARASTHAVVERGSSAQFTLSRRLKDCTAAATASELPALLVRIASGCRPLRVPAPPSGRRPLPHALA